MLAMEADEYFTGNRLLATCLLVLSANNIAHVC